MRIFTKLLLLTSLFTICALGAYAQKAHMNLSAEELVQANNPLATKKTINIHNYVISSLYGLPDVTMNSLMVRYAQPLGRVFLRASMPFMMSNAPGLGPTTGYGDFSLFAIYTFPKEPKGFNIGVGPMLVMPTGNNGFGDGKWQAGLSAVAFFSKSPVIQYGMLLEWQMSFASKKDSTYSERESVNTLIPQLFFMWQLGAGTYLRSTGTWSFDLKHGNYNMPLGMGMGKVIKAGKALFNIFAEPQFSVMAKGIGQPKFQVFIGFNTQF